MKCKAYIDPETKIALEGEALIAAFKNPDSPRCGYELGYADLFCPSCGATVEMSRNDNDIKRATRSTFWVSVMALIMIKAILFALASILASIMDGSLASLMFFRMLGWVELLAYAYFFKISVRRLHDINRSGWWIAPILCLTIIFTVLAVACESESVVVEVSNWAAIIATLGMIVWLGFVKGAKGPNKYGPDPLETK